MTDAPTQRWRAHGKMSENSGHVISVRDQSHLPAVENSHSHSPNADRQLHKHALFLQAVWTSGISSVRRPLNFVYTSLNRINDLLPTSQPKFRPHTLPFFPTRGKMQLSTDLIAKDNLQLEWRKRFCINDNPITWSGYSGTCTRWIPGSLLCSTPHNVMNHSQVINLLYLAVLIRAKSSSLGAN